MKHFLLISALWLTLNSVTSAQVNCALSFDGVDDYVACPAINPSGFTLEAWINPDGVINDQTIISTLNPFTATGAELHIKSSQVIATIWNGSTLLFQDISSTTTITAGNWVHIACTYTTGGLFVLYVNGTPEASATIPLYSQGTQQLILGRRSGQAAYFFDGSMDEVVVWNTVRTAEQIKSDMRGSVSTSSSGLQAYYRFNDGSGTTLADATGVNNGTLYNSPAWVESTTPKVTLSSATANMEAYADNVSITITSNISWNSSVSPDAPWITLSTYSGASGNTQMTISAAQNTTAEARTGTVTITDVCNLTTTFTVTQNKPTIGITISGQIILPASMIVYGVSFTSNTSWSASVSGDAPWLTLDAASGKGDYLLHITSSVNTTTKKRTGTVTITDGGTITIPLNFIQDSSYIELSPATIAEPLEDNNGRSVTIYTNTPWSASVNPEAAWLSLSETSGTGGSYITLNSLHNNTAAERSATITVTNGGEITRQVSVTQERPVADTIQVNNALAFDGKDDYVICPKVNPGTFTVEAWLKPAVVNTDQAVVSTLSVTENTGYELHIGPDGIPALTIRSGTSWLNVTGKSAVSVSKWTHLAASFDGSLCKLYVNGTLIATEAVSSYVPGAGNMIIGRRSSGSYFFNGVIDEVRVWNTVRSQSELIGSFRSSFTRPSDISNLISSFKSNQGVAGGDNQTINALADYSASLNTGALKSFDLKGGNTTSNFVAGYDASDAANILTANKNKLFVNDKTGSAVTFDIVSNTSWSISGTPAWMTLSSTSGTGNATITITAVSDNTSTEMRTAVITLAATGTGNFTVTVSQIPKITPDAPSVGDGSASNPYRIANLANLYWLSKNTDLNVLGSYFIQTADIDAFASAAFDDNKGFTPISSELGFSGSYNGKGHTIKGITINRPDVNYVGLFSRTILADIDSISIVDCSITGNDHSGGLAGSSESGYTNNCNVSGYISGASYVGGLTGQYTTGKEIDSCSFSGTVSGEKFVGGLVGLNISGSIRNSHFTGEVKASGDAVGGLAGENRQDCFVDNCYVTGTITGSGSVGGLVGFNQISDTLTNCFVRADVKGTYSVGGLVGYNYNKSCIKNCFSHGTVSGITPVGGLVGQNSLNCSISNSYSFSNVSGTDDAIGGLVGRNTSNCYVTGCNAGGNVSGNDYVGGVVGDNFNGSQVINCYGTGNVTGKLYVGGLIGYNRTNMSTEECYSTGFVSGDTNVGGLVGLNWGSSISYCYSTADITGSYTSGGLVGFTYEGNIKNCYSSGKTSGISMVGKFTGLVRNCDVSSCYWNKESSVEIPDFGSIGEGTYSNNSGLSTSEMKKQSFLLNLGSFSTVWQIREDSTYAALSALTNNAPFAFRDTVNVSNKTQLNSLLINDFDIEKKKDSLTLKVIRIYGTGITDSLTWYSFPDGTTTGTTDSLEYRVGELSASGDTLWGNRAIAVIRKIVNTAPVITSVAPANAITGIEYIYTVKATDAESNILTYSLSGQPAGMTINDSGIIRWTPQKGILTSGSVTLTVSDGEMSDTETFIITVSPTSDISTVDGTVIKLYPNPARDVVYLTGTTGMAYIYDITGRPILAKQIEEDGCIDVKILTKGTYFLRINGKSYKFIKL
jgi:hypothetical protein